MVGWLITLFFIGVETYQRVTRWPTRTPIQPETMIRLATPCEMPWNTCHHYLTASIAPLGFLETTHLGFAWCRMEESRNWKSRVKPCDGVLASLRCFEEVLTIIYPPEGKSRTDQEVNFRVSGNAELRLLSYKYWCYFPFVGGKHWSFCKKPLLIQLSWVLFYHFIIFYHCCDLLPLWMLYVFLPFLQQCARNPSHKLGFTALLKPAAAFGCWPDCKHEQYLGYQRYWGC